MHSDPIDLADEFAFEPRPVPRKISLTPRCEWCGHFASQLHDVIGSDPTPFIEAEVCVDCFVQTGGRP